ncbi:MAG: 4Fe-4S dicluster domain-containing protein [Desulfatiglandaceae bacterium]
MISKSFFGPAKTALRFPVLENIHKEIPIRVPEPETAFLHVYHKGVHPPSGIKPISTGDELKTGQCIEVDQDDVRASAVSPVTGVVSRMSTQAGYGEKPYVEIVLKVDREEQFDTTFRESLKEPASPAVLPFLDALPGNTDFSFISSLPKPIRAFIVCGIDTEPFMTTNQYILAAKTEELNTGIEQLRRLFRGSKVFLIAPPYLQAMARTTRAEVAVVDPVYPFTLPEMVLKKTFNVEIPAGKRIEELGVAFITAETLVGLAEAFETGTLPVHKHLTVIAKTGDAALVKARIGTTVKEVFSTTGIHASPGDLLVQGGPMTGRSIHSENMPILKNTEALLIRDKAKIPFSSDSHCINCGECIRACPAGIPVNMLVRVLENGLWEDAVGLYDLDACIECGLCSYVCPAKIPAFQYIMLGKHEVERLARAEEFHV